MPLKKVDKFVLSRNLYAIDADSYSVLERNTPFGDNIWTTYELRANAIWFKKKKGVVAAHFGTVWDVVRDKDKTSLESFLANHATGRYGGTAIALWDGKRFWSQNQMERAEEYPLIDLLQKALDVYPEVPIGYTGWYEMVQ